MIRIKRSYERNHEAGEAIIIFRTPALVYVGLVVGSKSHLCIFFLWATACNSWLTDIFLLRGQYCRQLPSLLIFPRLISGITAILNLKTFPLSLSLLVTHTISFYERKVSGVPLKSCLRLRKCRCYTIVVVTSDLLWFWALLNFFQQPLTIFFGSRPIVSLPVFILSISCFNSFLTVFLTVTPTQFLLVVYFW